MTSRGVAKPNVSPLHVAVKKITYNCMFVVAKKIVAYYAPCSSKDYSI